MTLPVERSRRRGRAATIRIAAGRAARRRTARPADRPRSCRGVLRPGERGHRDCRRPASLSSDGAATLERRTPARAGRARPSPAASAAARLTLARDPPASRRGDACRGAGVDPGRDQAGGVLEAQRAAGGSELEVAAALDATVAADEERRARAAQMQAARAAGIGRGYRNAKSSGRGKTPLESLLVGEQCALPSPQEPRPRFADSSSRLTSPGALSPPKQQQSIRTPVSSVSVVASRPAPRRAPRRRPRHPHSRARAPARRCLEPGSGEGPSRPPEARGARASRAPADAAAGAPGEALGSRGGRAPASPKAGLRPCSPRNSRAPPPSLYRRLSRSARDRRPSGPQAVDGPIVPRPSRKPTTGSPAVASSSTTAAPPSATSQVIGVPGRQRERERLALADERPARLHADGLALRRSRGGQRHGEADRSERRRGRLEGRAGGERLQQAAAPRASSPSRRKQPGSSKSTTAAASPRLDSRQAP